MKKIDDIKGGGSKATLGQKAKENKGKIGVFIVLFVVGLAIIASL